MHIADDSLLLLCSHVQHMLEHESLVHIASRLAARLHTKKVYCLRLHADSESMG